MRFIRTTIVGLVAFTTACGKDSTGPGTTQYAIAVQAGDQQFGVKNSQLSDPLQVVVTDPTTKIPEDGVTVTWQIVQGSGAALSTTTTTTNSKGVASVRLQLGDLGTYVVEATTSKLLGAPARFTAKAVNAPSITSVSPQTLKAGDTVTVVGTNFSTAADENIILFGGFRGKVTSATATQLRVIVPLCVPSRNNVVVQALLGAVNGNQSFVNVTGSSVTNALSLTRGQVRLFTDPNELSCFTVPTGVANLSLLFIPQSVSEIVGTLTTYELTGLTGNSTTVTSFSRPTEDFASAWELDLRRRERGLLSNNLIPALRPNSALAACPNPSVGTRCQFQVSNKDSKFTTVTAEVKAISAHAIIFQDINAPANGLTTSEFTSLGAMFDDPIYDTDVATFGSVSDMDNNGKVIILLTPVVNELTPRGSNGFIAGFFYACDLLPASSCSGTNSGEIFYALTADPSGQFGDARTRNTVIQNLPPVLAHEFQHMINWGARGNKTIDALWLSEGMAHHAEDVVADEFEKRNDFTNASLFHQQNNLRGNRYLRAVASTSLLGEDEASLELRGGAWLFVKYLDGRFGRSVLQNITKSTLSSVANVTAQTSRSWSTLLSDFAVALYADDNPELAGVTMNSIYTFPNMNARSRLANSDGTYPIKPVVYTFGDFTHRETLEASSQSYVTVQPGSITQPFNLSFTGLRGASFAANAGAQLTVLRVR